MPSQPSPRDWERIARLAHHQEEPRDPFGDRGDHLGLAENPTDAKPGSEEKLDVLIARVQGPRPVRLFHPFDERHDESTRALRAAYRMVRTDNGRNYSAELFAADRGDGLDDFFNEPFIHAAMLLAPRIESMAQAYRLACICWGRDAWASPRPHGYAVGVLRFPGPELATLQFLTFAHESTWSRAFTVALRDFPTRRTTKRRLTRLARMMEAAAKESPPEERRAAA